MLIKRGGLVFIYLECPHHYWEKCYDGFKIFKYFLYYYNCSSIMSAGSKQQWIIDSYMYDKHKHIRNCKLYIGENKPAFIERYIIILLLLIIIK